MEQPEYQYGPMTSGEIMKIHENAIYYPLDIIEKSRDLTILICRSHQQISPYSSVDLIKGFMNSYPVASRTGPIALLPAHLNYPLEYPRYRGEPGYSRYQMGPKLETGDANLYRHLFTYLEQLKDLDRLKIPGAEARPDTGDPALCRQLSAYQ
jgi:hypothetical protein